MRSAYTTPLFGLAFLIPCVALAATASPSFSAPNDFGIAPKIRSLAAVAGPDWREIAEFTAKRVPFCSYCDLKHWGPHSVWKASSKKIEEYV